MGDEKQKEPMTNPRGRDEQTKKRPEDMESQGEQKGAQQVPTSERDTEPPRH